MADGARDVAMGWSPEADVRLIAAHHAGMTLSQIAAELGVTRNAVAGRVMRLRNAGRLSRPEPPAEAAPPRPVEPRRSLAAADRLGETPSALAWSRHLEAIGNPPGFPPAVDLALVEGLARGGSLAQVAGNLGLDARAAQMRFFALMPVTGIEAQRLLLAALRARAGAA